MTPEQRREDVTRGAEATGEMVPCPTCRGRGCEHGCGQCYEFPATAGPDAHRQCITCFGAGEVAAP